ncbi:hypothetical protein ITG08_10745 [Vibrio cyclitrophicus]|uniref:hypothetical protein n=1 Tax=Vibrionaceae TaxID=641 RepID=UPI00029A79B0|nr:MULTISPECIES: hypothetical protein [Vibrionaceae]CAH7226747.1 conserved exported hypothetical protein [Vibrio chagasii]KAA8599535.1 hypothetical protein F0Z19_2660 [Vibrio cyclitrophicus]MBE1275160.1 hypothetical protein [Enterovibrio baiacu]MBU2933959.1 hypothetical protein [Vibrio cyclitrophicus]OBT29728.1 hypothetical protein A9263_06595 [Vibrio cyclitrophicus]|tara:strand:+ start:150 stop:632 length:483 start_codon:yes stop_codon:yes gene_type:complete
MKKVIILHIFLSVFVSTYSWAATISPTGSFGTLSVNNMTQGQLLWLNGRVGDATYAFTRQGEKACTLKVPVAVGRISEPDLGISETKGLAIVIVSQRLNDALLQGKRISSEEWNFTTKAYDENIDGLITSGISLDESFVLNSKRKWISWFLGDDQNVVCH